jgi:O-antigen ligase
VIQILLTSAFALSLPLKKRYYIISGSYILLCGALLPFTYSRSALVALVAGGLIFSLIRPRVIVPATILTFVTAIISVPANVRDRFMTNIFKYHYIEPLNQSLPVGPLHRRLTLWVSHLQRFNEQLILGNGFFVTHMDNTYLTLLVGSGFIGIMLTLYLFSQFISDCIGTFLCCRVEADNFNSGLALGTAATFIGFLSWGLFSEVFARWRILGIVFLLIGLTLEQAWRPVDENISSPES